MAFTLYIFFSPICLWAAPFADYFQFIQPDGEQLTLWGEGDEFHAVFETTAGYTVIFDPSKQAYFYAKRATNGKSLISTGVRAHKQIPPGLIQHTRMDNDAVNAAARARQNKWDAETGLSKRWAQLKSQTLGTPLAPDEFDALPAPPGTTTIGTKVGLTLLIDFSDDPSTISQSDIDAYVNSDSYTGFGNNGSVKQYFSDVSGTRLTYTNVVTIYVRMTQPKSYYNDTSKGAGIQGRLLINDALDILKARSDYNSTILPTFSSLTTDGSDNVVAFNVFFTGATSGAWKWGLWPHFSVLSSDVPLGNGKSVYLYQITNIGTSLQLGTFTHENGHMLCSFPDLYDYDKNIWGDSDSKGGAGIFSLMGQGGHGVNPIQVDAYLKLAAGWATVTDVDSFSNLEGTLVAAPDSGYNHFYRYRRPGVTTEYFLLENRQNAGRDANLPAAGIAIWHVDELGDRDNQSMVPNSSHLNYELTLVQADNLWHFQNNINNGDANDLYYQGNSALDYTNRLDDSSSPHANWWDGTTAGLKLYGFSVAGTSMNFEIETRGSDLPAPVLSAEPPVTSGTENIIYWSEVPDTVDIRSSDAPMLQKRVEGTWLDHGEGAANSARRRYAGDAIGGIDDGLDVRQHPLQSVSETITSGDDLWVDDRSEPAQATLSLDRVFVQQVEGEKVLSASEPLLAPVTIFSETFEGSFPGSNWTLFGSPTWDDTSYDRHGGSRSGWCGYSSLFPSNGYTDNMKAWMIYGPFSLADATSASMTFWYKNLSESNNDYFSWMASVNGNNFYGYKTSGDQDSWRSQELDLTNVLGQPQVWIAFKFDSNGSISGPEGYTGAYVDDVIITKEELGDTPDLTPYKFPYWNDKIPVGITQLGYDDVHNYSGDYYYNQTLYFNWASLNQGSATSGSYTVHAEVTGIGGGSWDYPCASQGVNQFCFLPRDQAVGPLAAGSHTFKVRVDYTDEVGESDEGNNYYERTITVTPGLVEYNAEYADNSNFNSPVDSGWIMQTQWTFSDLTPGQTYWYRVKARRGSDESNWSNIEYSQQEILLHTITATGAGNGSGTIAGNLSGDVINASWNGEVLNGDSSALVTDGSGPYTLSAAAAVGSTASWTSGCDTTSGNGKVTATCTLNAPVISDKYVIATFDLDTDNDGLPDDLEDVNQNGIVDAGETDPNNPDTDNDGLNDGVEVNILGTNPLEKDTDGNGIPDGDEDNDGDGFTNGEEVQCGSDPGKPYSKCRVGLPWLMLLLE